MLVLETLSISVCIYTVKYFFFKFYLDTLLLKKTVIELSIYKQHCTL